MDLMKGKRRRGAEITVQLAIMFEIMLIVVCNYPKFLNLGMFGIA